MLTSVNHVAACKGLGEKARVHPEEASGSNSDMHVLYN
jgi:hypothetical protein